MRTNLEIDIGHRTDTGRRRQHNEDCLGIYVPQTDEEIETRGTLLVVADGMGGYAAGEVASHIAVETVVDNYYEDAAATAEEGLSRALDAANQSVLHEASRDAGRSGMGTTIAVAAILDGELAAANVGDSRVYLIRDGTASQISHDHSWVAELLEVGKITAEEARHHPMRNVVTRSLGGRPEVEVELYPRHRLKTGDVLLVCSDGLWGMVSAEEISSIVESLSAQAAADALIVAANQAGGHDNITAIVCRVVRAPEEDTERSAERDALRKQDTEPVPKVT